MRKWTRLGSIAAFGAPIFIHWSVLVAVALLALMSLGSPVYAAIAIASYLAVITVHELGHAYVARRLGYDVEAIRVAVIHGQCEYSAPDSEWDEVLIVWGGVVAQIGVAMVVLAVAAVLGNRELGYFGPVVVFLGYLNLLIAAMNLAPSAGLDGKLAWRIVPLLMQQWRAKRIADKSLRAIAKRK